MEYIYTKYRSHPFLFGSDAISGRIRKSVFLFRVGF